MSTYTFNKHKIKHRFCSTLAFTRTARAPILPGKAWLALNVRCLEGVATCRLSVKQFDGRSL